MGGKDVTQGVGGAPVGAAVEPAEAGVRDTDRSRNVFVVYGRDEQARQAVFGLLRRLDLRPLEWEPLVHATGGGAPFLGQGVAGAPALAQASRVGLAPGDVGMVPPALRGGRGG